MASSGSARTRAAQEAAIAASVAASVTVPTISKYSKKATTTTISSTTQVDSTVNNKRGSLVSGDDHDLDTAEPHTLLPSTFEIKSNTI